MYGKDAYEAYSGAAGGKSLVSGDALPEWDQLPAPIRDAWDAAAEAAIAAAEEVEHA